MSRLVLLGALCALLAPAALAQAPAPCLGGQATLGGQTYACSGIDLYAVVTPQSLGASAPGQCTQPYPSLCANDVWGWTDPETGREIAIVGLHNGTAFVDVTSPATPVRLGRMPPQAANSSWRDVKALGNVAVVVSEARDHGMQIFDLTRLRGLGEDAARTFAPDAVYDRVGSAHNVAVNEATGFAYAVGFRTQGGGLPASCGARGVHAVDLRNPLQPAFAGCFSDAAQETGPRTPGYTHDLQCVVYTGPDADYAGREICLAANEDVVTVFDATDKNAVVTVSQGAYPGASYTHQAWFVDGQRYVLANDELDEITGSAPFQRTLVYDMSDLDAPEFVGQYTSALTTVDHNLYVAGGLAYESNYEAGLRVIDLAGVATGALSEAAFFDTYPQATRAEFNGQWSNYPYFASGTVVASDANNGLFLLRLTNASTAEAPGAADGRFALSAPVPNPTGGDARLTLSVPTPQRVRAVLVDALGREVQTLFDGRVEDAREIAVRSAGLPAGTYVVRVVGERETATRAVAIAR